MPLTLEQKKVQYAAKKEAEEAKRHRDSAHLALVAPPNKALKRPNLKANGNNKADYGGHQKALNFLTKEEYKGQFQLAFDNGDNDFEFDGVKDPAVIKCGTLAIGLCYEGDWKQKSKIAGNGERKMCLESEKYLQFLTAVKDQLLPMVPHTARG